MRTAISRSEVWSFARTLGADPDDTVRVEIVPGGVTVTTYKRDEQGRRVVVDGDLATEVAAIAIVGEGDAGTVRMRHPDLRREIDVPASAVGHHAFAGWEVVPPTEPATESTSEPGPSEPAGGGEAKSAALMAEPVADEQPKKTPRSRRKTSTEED